nr:unnamed protein product [Callosobruchus analis]
MQYEIVDFSYNFNENIEICDINVFMDDRKLSVNSLYRPPNDCIIGGDFNTHHGMWGSPINSNDGNILAEAVEYFQDLVATTRFSPSGQAKSVVDINIPSSKLCSSFDWSTLADTFGSDHFPVNIVIKGVCPENLTAKPISKWSMKNANWNVYRSEIENSFSGCAGFEHSNDMIVLLSNTITSAANKSCRILTPLSIRNKSPLWWDEECSLAVAIRKEAFKNY